MTLDCMAEETVRWIKGGGMGDLARKDEGKRRPAELCELCGEALEIDPESRDGHCIFCEEPEREA